MNDAFSLASTGDLDFAVALETMNFLQKERGAYVWQSAIQIIAKLYTSLGPTEAYPLFEVRTSNIWRITNVMLRFFACSLSQVSF